MEEHNEHHVEHPVHHEHPKESHGAGHVVHHKIHTSEKFMTKQIVAVIIIAVLVILFNQFQINSISGMLSGSVKSSSQRLNLFSGGGNGGGNTDLTDINIDELESTAHTIQAVYSLEGLDGEGVMAEMFPTGTPDYGAELEISYDDPVASLAVLAKMYRGLKAEVQKNNPEGWDRYLNLALKPVGISCEYCCGVGPIGIRKDGSSSCGCQHNPAVLTIALYLSAYTDYTDGEILREVMNWKTLFFPRNMIELGTSLAGGDTSALENLPGMVGGC